MVDSKNNTEEASHQLSFTKARVSPTLLVMKNSIAWIGVLLLVLVSSCSHSKPKTEEASPIANVIPTPTDTPLAMPDCGKRGCGSSENDYLNSVALPKILNSSLVQECFLNRPKVKAKELKPGFLSFRFEIKLVPEGKKVVPESVYLSSFQNVPEWTKPCLIKGYQNFVFPPFPDKNLKSTSAFGTVNTTWAPKH